MSSTVLGLSASTALGAFIGTVIGLAPIVRDYHRHHWKKRFKQQVSAGIKNKKIDYERMQHVAERWAQDRTLILENLRELLADAIESEDEGEKQVDVLSQLIEHHQKLEPHAELPENISLQLHQIESFGGESQAVAQALAKSLGSLYQSNQEKIQRQQKYTFWGCLFGAIGVVFSGVIWWFS